MIDDERAPVARPRFDPGWARRRAVARAVRDERGLTEYAVLLGVIMLGIAALLVLMRGAATHQDGSSMRIERMDGGNER
jgi:hypothetical protein